MVESCEWWVCSDHLSIASNVGQLDRVEMSFGTTSSTVSVREKSKSIAIHTHMRKSKKKKKK